MRHPAHARVIPNGSAVGVEQTHGLGNVDGPSPSAGYDGPAPFPSEQVKRLPDMAVGGFGRDIRKNRAEQPRLAQGLEHRLHNA